ncbi:hypothetical protein BKA93DRAFT_26621 [Sparassis latifolia]
MGNRTPLCYLRLAHDQHIHTCESKSHLLDHKVSSIRAVCLLVALEKHNSSSQHHRSSHNGRAERLLTLLWFRYSVVYMKAFPPDQYLEPNRYKHIYPSTQVPHLACVAPYDTLGFPDFPARIGWEVLEYKQGQEIRLHRLDQQEASTGEQISLLQEWLFFGVLGEMFGICDMSLDVSHFVHSKIVSTAPLKEFTASWAGRLGTVDRAILDARSRRMHGYLDVMDDFMFGWHPRQLSFDEAQVLHSIVMARSFCHSMFLWYLPENSSDVALYNYTPFGPSCSITLEKGAVRHLLDRGWCKSDVSMLCSAGIGETIFLITALERSATTVDHSECTDTVCNADCLDEETYVTRHVRLGCTCPHIQVDGGVVATILANGGVPRIRVPKISTSDEDIHIEVVDDGPYVAISHVWSHGLGNPRDNALPQCQLSYIAASISLLDSNKCASPSVWIDTLCIPVDPALREHRKTAITRLGKIFSEAYQVLVLDAELEKASVRCSIIEQGLRILCSDWMRRLWTLQEAVFVQNSGRDKLYFQFADGVVAHSSLDVEQNEASPHRNNIHVVHGLHGVLRALEDRIPRSFSPSQHSLEDPEPTERPIYKLARMSGSLQYRATSKAEDEPVCLASLLGLDVRSVLVHSSAKRMRQLYLLIGTFPATIIFTTGRSALRFNDGARLQERGFRWAPASYLSHQASFQFRNVAMASVDSEGLHASYGLFTSQPRLFRECLFIGCSDGGIVYRISGSPDDDDPPPRVWLDVCASFGQVSRAALIFDDSSPDDSFRVAVVSIQGDNAGVLHATILARGWNMNYIDGEPDEHTIAKLRDASGIVNGEFTASDQRWCIT